MDKEKHWTAYLPGVGTLSELGEVIQAYDAQLTSMHHARSRVEETVERHAAAHWTAEEIADAKAKAARDAMNYAAQENLKPKR